jgi:hypothetical protein
MATVNDAPALVFNIERVDASDLRAQDKHDNRKGGNLDHIRSERTHRNKTLVGSGDPHGDALAVIDKHGAKLRKDNRAPFDRIVLSASRHHFTGQGRDITGWARDAVAWLRKEYGPGLAYVQAHLDEKTPHIHAVAVPLVDRREKGRGWVVSHSQHPSHQGRNSYAKMRKRASDAMGLAYGEAGGKPKAKALREAEERLADAKRQSQEILSNAATDAAIIIEKSKQEAREIRRKAALKMEVAKATQNRANSERDRNIALGSRLAAERRSIDQEKQARAIEKAIADSYPQRPARQRQRQRKIGD